MKSFLSACGLTDALQLVVERQSADEGELRLFDQPFVVIGRDPRADVVLDHSDVSRRHVYLQVVNGHAFWVDLESRTGTRGDGQSLASGWLEDGRTLGLGPYVMRRVAGEGLGTGELRRSELPRELPLVAQARGQAPPDVALEFLNGPSRSMAWPVRRVMSLIGSASGCKFRLTDASVSRFHSSLVRTSSGLWIVDLLGQGGITVNEVPVRFSQLTDGDMLRIGRYQIRVQCRPVSEYSESALADHSRARPTARTPAADRGSKGLMFPDWPNTTPAFQPITAVPSGALVPTPISPAASFPKVEVLSTGTALSVKLPSSELTESMLVPLVNQFGLMQQQMFDQFQQAMAMMVQMFGTMHRDQMEVIRAELSQLHQLTEEFHALKDELASRTQQQGNAPRIGPAAAPVSRNPSTKAHTSVSAVVQTHQRTDGSQSTKAATMSSGQSHLSSSNFPDQHALPPQSKSSPQPLSGASPKSEPRAQAKTNSTTPLADSERDSIMWLHERILALHQERESRWQKILKLLPGLS